MDEFGARVAGAARALVGVPFRLQGRDEAGLDCVGLVALALARAGHVGLVPARYGLRSGDVGLAGRWLGEAGLRPVAEARVGDLWLVRPGPLQLHLMIGAPGGFVHAHAGLRRVVEMPGVCCWPVVGVWRGGGAHPLIPFGLSPSTARLRQALRINFTFGEVEAFY